MTHETDEIREYRRAARALLRMPELDEARRLDSLVGLVRHARGAELPEMCMRAIAEEVELSIELPDLIADAWIDPTWDLHRKLRTNGPACRTCKQPLLTEANVDREKQFRLDAIAELRTREAAIA